MCTYATDRSPDDFDKRVNARPDLALPQILLASDNVRLGESLRRTLHEDGFLVELASSYEALEGIWQQLRHPVVLLDVSHLQSVDAAVGIAMSIKRHDSTQFVGYVADPILRTSGLAGDAIFPRNLQLLPDAIRAHFAAQIE
ncbi:PleD family two-component response regulator [Silvibacterium bohemicum]|uniref:PleD family two-component response regulator n=1 Tax=Silvibacterium bohemicum TaxID=1577686 RepID=A0A841K0A1_9BACT|nr:PleD family two-component response regulator [Silvibacterium bohemicum]